MSDKKNNSMAAAAMIEMLDKTGAFDDGMTERGAKFTQGLFNSAFGKTRRGFKESVKQGKGFSEYLSPQAREKRKRVSAVLSGRDKDALMGIIKSDQKLGNIASRILVE